MTIQEALDSYFLGMRSRDLATTTIERYVRTLTRFQAFCAAAGVTEMKDLRADHARRWILERQGQVSAITAHYGVTPLKAWTRWLESEELISRDPFRVVRKPKLPRNEMRVVPAAGVRRLLRCFDRSDPDQYRDLCIIKLIVSTGLRRSEALGARLSDLDVPERTLIVRGKGRKERRVLLSDDVALMLHRYVTSLRKKHKPSTDHVFVSRRHGALDGTAFGKRFQEYVRLANLGQHVTLHHLRHFAATAMLGAGASVELVSRQLGHADSRITSAVYSHVSFADVAAMHKQFDPLKLVEAS